jgi:hypothetical protein
MKLFKILFLGLAIVAGSCRRVDIELEQALTTARKSPGVGKGVGSLCPIGSRLAQI